MRASLAIACLIFFGVASAEPLRARDTALVRDRGSWSIGVFNPLTLAVRDGLELELHPLVLVAAPHALVRVAHMKAGEWRLAGEYGLSFPLTALKMAPPLGVAGYFTPSCKVAKDNPAQAKWCEAPGWFLVPRAGAVLSLFGTGVFSARADLAVGLLLSGQRGYPLDAPPVVELLFAPFLNRFRARVGAGYDRPLSDRVRVRGEANLYAVGGNSEPPEPTRSPLTVSVHLGVDIGLGQSSRLTLGVLYFNSDQHAVSVEPDGKGKNQRVRIRSQDFLPTVDFIWSS